MFDGRVECPERTQRAEGPRLLILSEPFDSALGLAHDYASRSKQKGPTRS
jgi:hypothetical protein